MSLESKLLEIFADNFVTYYSAHSNHINVTGRNFYSDHKLLGKIYEDAQEQIDTLGEFIRTIEAKVPATIPEILDLAMIGEMTAEDSDNRLRIIGDNQEYMMERYKELFDIATEMTDQDIANYAADRIGVHAKFKWMIESTLEIN